MDLDTLTPKNREQDGELDEEESDEGTADEQDEEREEQRSNKESENDLEENHSIRGNQVNIRNDISRRARLNKNFHWKRRISG